MVEVLPNTCKVLGSIPINGERERKKNRAQSSSSMHTENNKWGHLTFCHRCLGEKTVIVCVWLGRMLPSETVQKRKSSVRLRVEAA